MATAAISALFQEIARHSFALVGWHLFLSYDPN